MCKRIKLWFNKYIPSSNIKFYMASIKTQIRLWFCDRWFFLKNRTTVLGNRFNRFLAFLSIFITYYSAIIILLIYFKPNFPYTLLIMFYVVALAIPLAVFTIYFVIIIHFAFFPKKRKWFDGQFNYSEKELMSFSTQFANLEKEVANMKSTLTQIVEGKKHGKSSAQLICPNGCNITQAGSKFCGQCGEKLIRR